jgi:hypothetical protein
MKGLMRNVRLVLRRRPVRSQLPPLTRKVGASGDSQRLTVVVEVERTPTLIHDENARLSMTPRDAPIKSVSFFDCTTAKLASAMEAEIHPVQKPGAFFPPLPVPAAEIIQWRFGAGLHKGHLVILGGLDCRSEPGASYSAEYNR